MLQKIVTVTVEGGVVQSVDFKGFESGEILVQVEDYDVEGTDDPYAVERGYHLAEYASTSSTHETA